jgi:trk system potassium uptake protein TrkA
MRIAILGAGSTGSYIASILSEKKHDVTLIDRDGKLLEQIGRSHDVATLHAALPNVNALQELGETSPDLFFAATGSDETNLAACSVAKKLGFKKTAARVKSREYLDRSKLDWGQIFQIDYFIGAEVLAAQGLFEALIHAGDVAVEHFAHGAIQMRTFLIPLLWDRGAIPIRDLALPEELIVGLIRRKTIEEDKILFPHGEDFILPGDEATIVGKVKAMEQLHEIFRYPEHKVRSVVIVGGTAVAIHLSHFLNAQKISVRLIEESEEQCERLAEELPNVTIIHRDPQDPELMQSE